MKLLQNNIYNAGTVRSNQNHLSKSPQNTVSADKEMKKEEVAAFTANKVNSEKMDGH